MQKEILNIPLKYVVDSLPDAAFVVDRSGFVVVWNHGMENLTGKSNSEIVGKPCSYCSQLLNKGGNPPLALRLVADIGAVADQKRGEYRSVLKSEIKAPWAYKGRGATLSALSSTLHDQNGHIVGAIEVLRDITDYKEQNEELKSMGEQLQAALQQLRAAEEELRYQYQELQIKEANIRESERRFRGLLETMPLAAVIVNQEGLIVFANDYCLEATGWSREELLNHAYAERFFLSSEHERVGIWLKRMMAEESMERTGTVAVTTKTGDKRWFRWAVTHLYKPDGELEGVAILGDDITELEMTQHELRRQINYLNTIIDNLNEIFCTFDPDMRVTFVNKKSAEILGYYPEELIGRGFSTEFIPEDYRDFVFEQLKTRLSSGEPACYELPFYHKNGEVKILKVNSAALWDDGKIIGSMVLADDITKERETKRALKESETAFRRITDNMLDLISQVDRKGRLLYASPSHQSLLGYSQEEMKKVTLADIVHPDDLISVTHALKTVLRQGVTVRTQQRTRHVGGGYIWTETVANPVIENGKVVGAILSSRDITDRKKLEDELRYLSMHDNLTGLYNRAYFEEEMSRLESGRFEPVGMIICDLDGLKLINDALGHYNGDRLLITAARLLRQCFRSGDVVARIGGDEFAVLLPYTDREAMVEVAKRINDKLEEYNRQNPELPLNLSIGMAVRTSPEKSMRDLFKEADSEMYHAKLLHGDSQRDALVSHLIKALDQRDFNNTGHTENMCSLASRMCQRMGMGDNLKLLLLCRAHDIGKVGVPESILFKAEFLTPEERIEVKRHTEIGYRIALSSVQFAPIADLILKHHEWWNGEGYPLGLKGEEIPLECRMFAIIEAFEVITGGRPYRPKMTQKEALAELRRMAGVQFDPVLTEEFVKMVEG